MSDITRWKVSGPTTRLQPDANGPWVALVDYYHVIVRLIAERDEARADVKQLTAERDDHRFEVERLTAELHRTRADGIELRWVEGEVEQLTAERDAARGEVERLKNAIGYLTRERDEAQAERDAAQRERERVQDLLTLAGRELSTLRESLRQPRRDQSAQNLDMANGQAILDSSRPTDEDIWREAFMRFIEEKNAVECADIRLAEYRKRWPR